MAFGTEASFHPSYTALKVNSVIYKNKGTSLWNFVLNSGLLASVYRSSKRVIDLARRRWRRAERDKLGRRRSTKMTILPSSDARPLVYHSNHQALFTAQFRRAGQLATTDTCYYDLGDV